MVTLMEGAFVCVGFPYVAKLCRNVLDSLLKGRLITFFFLSLDLSLSHGLNNKEKQEFFLFFH